MVIVRRGKFHFVEDEIEFNYEEISVTKKLEKSPFRLFNIMKQLFFFFFNCIEYSLNVKA